MDKQPLILYKRPKSLVSFALCGVYEHSLRDYYQDKLQESYRCQS